MKTITLFTVVVELYEVPFGPINPILKREIIELNEHVKRKQNE